MALHEGQVTASTVEPMHEDASPRESQEAARAEPRVWRQIGAPSATERIEFDDLLLEAIRDGLQHVLGEASVRMVLFHLELIRHAKNPGDFHEQLSAVFKDGAQVLERMIVKELFHRLGMHYRPREDFDFVRFVNAARELVAAGLEVVRW